MRGELPPRLVQPFKLIAFDWDGTAVVSRREDTVQLRGALERLLRIGVSSIIITGTNFANIEQQLLATMRGPHKRNLYVSTNRGSEVYGFDAQSRPVLLWQRVAAREENRLLSPPALSHAMLIAAFGFCCTGADGISPFRGEPAGMKRRPERKSSGRRRRVGAEPPLSSARQLCSDACPCCPPECCGTGTNDPGAGHRHLTHKGGQTWLDAAGLA